jgi:O-antigen/teichoic acid export membrane protein
LVSYGGWLTLASAIAPLVGTLDRLIVGALSGAAAVTAYTVPFNLASRITVLPGSLSAALFPRLSAQKEAEAQGLMREALEVLLTVITPILVVMTLVMRPFLAWWVGPNLAVKAGTVGEIVCVGLWFNCLAYLPRTRMQARGRPDLVLKLSLLQLPLTIPLFWSFISLWGLEGAAIAWSVRASVGALLQFIANDVGVGVVSRLLVPALFIAATLCGVTLLKEMGPPRIIFGLAIIASIATWALRQKAFQRHSQTLLKRLPFRKRVAARGPDL